MSTGSNSTYSNNNANNSNTAANNAANNNAATRSCDTNTIADLSSDLNGGGGASAGGCCCGCWRLGCCACQNNNNNHCHCACWNAFWDRAYASCLLPTSEKVLASAIWRVVLVIGNILLLFGHPLQMLWLPKGADPVMDVIYCVVLVVFLIDMVFRATAVAGYFGISVTRYVPWLDFPNEDPFVFTFVLFQDCGMPIEDKIGREIMELKINFRTDKMCF